MVFQRILIVAIILTIISLIALYINGLDLISINFIESESDFLFKNIQDNYLISVLIFIFIYIVTVSLSIPGASLLSVLGGFFFTSIPATIYIVISATIGATVVFLLSNFLLRFFSDMAKPDLINRFQLGFKENEFSYLLVLRLLPVFPFFLINIVSGLLNIRIVIFILATFLGIIPGTFVYAFFGSNLSSLLELGDEFNLNSILMNTQIVLSLLALAFLVILPVFVKFLKKNGYLKVPLP